MTEEEFIEALLSAPDAQARKVLMENQAEYLQVSIAYVFKERANRVERDDPRQTVQIGLVAEEFAQQLGSDEALALALWAQANGHLHLAELGFAAHCYERAAVLFKMSGKHLQAARTSIGHMSTLNKMGEFEKALELAKAAHEVFVREGDLHYQALTDMNLGKLYESQGQYTKSLEHSRRATEVFESLGETLHVAMTQVNQANTLVYLDVFLMAEELLKLAIYVFETAGLRSAVASVYNDLAILQYYRGNYSDAFQTFEHARSIFVSLAEQGNLVLTDLEESDLYLDLNLPEEALRLAKRAESVSSDLGLTYEIGRAHVNQAISLARLGQEEIAITMLERARNIFLLHGHETWVAYIDLQRAEILGNNHLYRAV